jgi:hypothetical protein
VAKIHDLVYPDTYRFHERINILRGDIQLLSIGKIIDILNHVQQIPLSIKAGKR